MSDEVDARTLTLLLSITFLAFFVAFFTSSEYFASAIFTTVGLPVVYTIRYFRDKELIGLTSAFLIGYLIFVAITNVFSFSGMMIYTFAFLMSLLIRAIIFAFYSVAPSELVRNPIFCTIFAIAIATLLAPLAVIVLAK